MEKSMPITNLPNHRKTTLSPLVFLALTLAVALLGPTGCSRAKAQTGLKCSLVELRPNPSTHYYDAVVRVDSVTIRDPLKERFQAVTFSSTHDLSTLKFTAEGADPVRLEAGDTFVIPLKRPDWKFSILESNAELCAERFWDRLPPDDRWHPTKTEGMAVALSIEITNERGVLKPAPISLPPEWRLTDETEPTADNAIGTATYRKQRGGRLVEQVEIQYARLTDEQKAQLEAGSPADFLSGWSECAKSGGVSGTIAGHAALVCDLEGVGDFGWTYRFFYTTSGLVVAADIQSDPAELGKTDAEKELERRTDQVFLRYGYGPLGKEEWQVMIELRMNRTGAFHKRSRAGETVDKDFHVSDDEFSAIEKALAEHDFWLLESHSTIGPGFESFISVRTDERARTVSMKNSHEPPFEDIAKTIRGIILPKVNENGMEPPTR
jgi:hypothetical protein